MDLSRGRYKERLEHIHRLVPLMPKDFIIVHLDGWKPAGVSVDRPPLDNGPPSGAQLNWRHPQEYVAYDRHGAVNLERVGCCPNRFQVPTGMS